MAIVSSGGCVRAAGHVPIASIRIILEKNLIVSMSQEVRPNIAGPDIAGNKCAVVSLHQKQILNLLQEDIPLVCRPWHNLARRLAISPAELIAQIRLLRQQGLLRRIAAIFNPVA